MGLRPGQGIHSKANFIATPNGVFDFHPYDVNAKSVLL